MKAGIEVFGGKCCIILTPENKKEVKRLDKIRMELSIKEIDCEYRNRKKRDKFKTLKVFLFKRKSS